MASYAMAHLKMDMLLTETGYKATTDQRFRIFLTNSLEESHADTGTLFSGWLSDEADQANAVKRDTPVMVIIGNPPYSGESANKGDWIMKLMEDYKKEPGGKEKLKEQNSKFINDDYVKFLRYGQHFIEKNGSGVLAFINPHGFLDNSTFRGMRWNLLKTYDKIYTIDLHGNAKKKETAPDGSPDINVFDIEQGVSINIFIKTTQKSAIELGKVYHYDVFGKRDYKYEFLLENTISSIAFKNFTPFENDYYFKVIDENRLNAYNEGINPIELFKINVMGFQTHRDNFCIDEKKEVLNERLLKFTKSTESEIEISKMFGIKSSSDFNISKAKIELSKVNIDNELIKCSYRPFENRFIYYDKILVDRPQTALLTHSKNKENILLGIGGQGLAVGNIEWCLATVSKYPVDANVFRRGGVNLFPLYLYNNPDGQQTLDAVSERTPNLNSIIVEKISNQLHLRFTSEKESNGNSFAPIDILDYIYAVLHSPAFREKNKEFLKIDFPRIPYPENQNSFWKLVKLGGELRQIHLLESPEVNNYITQYPIDGDNIVTKIKFEENYEIIDGDTTTLMDPVYLMGRVYINDTQYFQMVPEVAWNFYIGGYQPAQKWLKDRKGRELSFEDILHYQKIIVALKRTDEIMKEIDLVKIN